MAVREEDTYAEWRGLESAVSLQTPGISVKDNRPGLQMILNGPFFVE